MADQNYQAFNLPDSKGNMHCYIKQRDLESCGFAVAGMAYYLCKGYQNFSPEIGNYMADYSRTLQQQWTYPGGGLGMYDINQLLTSVGISTAGLLSILG